MVPPRRCRRVAVDGAEYCEVHVPHSDLQTLLRGCFRTGWEYGVERWIKEQEVKKQRRERGL